MGGWDGSPAGIRTGYLPNKKQLVRRCVNIHVTALYRLQKQRSLPNRTGCRTGRTSCPVL